jgi:hypothetical protein
LGISESGKGFSQIGNIRGEVVNVQPLEPIQGERIGLPRVNMGKRLMASLRSLLLLNKRRKVKSLRIWNERKGPFEITTPPNVKPQHIERKIPLSSQAFWFS